MVAACRVACMMAWILAGVSIALLLLWGGPVYAVGWAASALDVAVMWFLMGGCDGGRDGRMRWRA